jgi:hypothetical protein
MAMNSVPPLALALAASAASRLRWEEREAALRVAFVPVIAEFDEADEAYRRAIEAAVPAQAGAIIAAMRGFRERVAAVRAQARAAIGEAYRRNGGEYGAFDPLDAYVPPTTGLSHADGTRVATMSDDARMHVAKLRAQVNEEVLARLAPAELETLTAAKVRRRDAFEAALRSAVQRALGDVVAPAEVEKTVYALVPLADGWY